MQTVFIICTVVLLAFPKLSCVRVCKSETSMCVLLSEVFLFVISGVVVVSLCP